MEYFYLLLLPQQIQFFQCKVYIDERWISFLSVQQINKFLLAMEGIAIITGDIQKKAAGFNGGVDGARTH